ncbi:hypothetical protein FRB94_012147 [Tulasnella sp. JGI-2019a]|nr:hypothetical protein FRB94_012147 [Tulasnella sp. JGI-2019a]KAG9024198.1 hypothetical protein FRB95_011958 [Tulasnella sp. JGI-2019a]
MISLLPILAVPFVSAARFVPRQQGGLWGGFNITAEVLGVQAAISSPVCNATSYCVTFVTQTIPTCERLGDNPGCWCGDVDPLHYCAICMSSPTDNSTTPEQTQDALTHHINYHKGCGAYEAWYNATLSSSAAPSSTSTSSSASATPTVAPVTSGSSKSNIGPIVGGAVGGVIGLIIILAILFLIYRNMQNKHQQIIEGTTGRMSVFSGGALGGEMGHASKYEVGTAPTGVTPIIGPGSVVGSNSGRAGRPGSATGSHTPPPFNPYAVPTLGPRMMNPDPDTMSEFRGPGMGSLSPAPMYQPQPQMPPPNWRESLASAGTYDTSMGSRGGNGAYDTSMLEHLGPMPMTPPGHAGSPYRSGSDTSYPEKRG